MNSYLLKRGATVLVAVLLGISGVASAQDSPPAQKPSAPIRLALRGKRGDTALFKTNMKMKFDMTIHQGEKVVEKQNQANTGETSESWKLRSLLPNGSLLFEKRTLFDKSEEEENGQKKTITKPAEAWLVTLTATGETLSKKPLETAPAPAAKSGKKAGKGTKGKPSAPVQPAKSNNTKMGQNLRELPFTFPNKPVQVGDTWTGTISIEGQGAQVPYSAQLVSIETHRNVPCAKVVYTLRDFGAAFGLNLDTFKKAMPADSKTEGNVNLDGLVTVYYSLDRAIDLDTDIAFTGLIDVKVTVADPSTKQEQQISFKGDIHMAGQKTATQFPAYDASLLARP